ncbi:aldehyde dehydrogenase family protein [Skermanella mucosa]|uniref:aldehyde dehydrogenase family protein n=1 Tax=Skermanella mucosa TaxID=1789672 RepID=UPI00192C9A7B|nr:aldehyde dehydrogenase family protein [Skermanella mucosa]UEM22426.1 aldehyde dehydrogenase family protein [Skermanella mucosa]
MTINKNLIAGSWVESTDVIRNINPSNTDDVVGEYAAATAEQVEQAVAAARTAFPAWSRSPIQNRADMLEKIGNEILERRDELGRLLAREEGKPLADGVGEATRAGHIFKFFGGEVLRLQGEKVASTRPGVEIEITREPIGVVGLITPWNFPIAIPAWKIAPALAYGNCVVLKPAELTPGCAWALADIISRAGIPEGVFNLVMGSGSKIGSALIGGVDALSFTGSVPTGRKVAAQAVERMIKFQLEMGGKNPLVVLDDADLDTAVSIAVNGAYFQTGQRCTASSRMVVTQGIHDRFVDAVAERISKLVVGDALKPETQMGPAVDQRQLDQNLKYVAIGQEEGARKVFGGDRLNRDTPGFYMSPCLFTETTNDMRVNREEIFGPVGTVIRVKDYEEALHVANDTQFGLSAGIATTSLKHANHFRANSQAGMVMVNLPTAGVDYHVPFGGRKASSYGPREQGRYAAEFYTTVKTSYILP